MVRFWAKKGLKGQERAIKLSPYKVESIVVFCFQFLQGMGFAGLQNLRSQVRILSPLPVLSPGFKAAAAIIFLLFAGITIH